jgi:hypothetical protein
VRISRNRLGVALLAAAVVLATGAAGAGARSSAGVPWIVVSAVPSGTSAQISQLFRVQTDGAGLQQLTSGGLPATSPSFMADGKSIVFQRIGSGLFRINLDGSGLKRLTSGQRDTFPVPSRDGKSIAFIRPLKTDWRLFVMPAAGGKPRLLAKSPPVGRPTWAADSKSLYAPSGADIIHLDATTGKVLGYAGLVVDIDSAHTATVSPNAKQIAYVGPRISTGPPDCGEARCPQFGLYLANWKAPHRVKKLVNDTGPAGWAPDSNSLVFVEKGALTIWNVSGGAESAIPTAPHVLQGDTPPTWQPRT